MLELQPQSTLSEASLAIALWLELPVYLRGGAQALDRDAIPQRYLDVLALPR